MNYKYFILEKEENILKVKINRPNNLNALNSEVLKELDKLLDEIENDEEIYVLIFTGEGKSFIAGADIDEMSELDFNQAVKFSEMGQKVFLKLEELSKPTIAAINGYCLGGGNEFALSCDIRIASEKAKFGQPEVTLGITPGFAGTQRLAKLVGVSIAKEIVFTGGMYDAEYAKSIGLVSKVVSKDELMNEVMILAKKIAKNGQVAVRYSKKAINEGSHRDITIGNKIEANYFGLSFSTKDQKKAMKAFLNKEKYKFENK
ncbi:MAG: enoyl-CoA hydratase/isomerase family protein [Clostridiales bacterium]|nr:enoyl-CoA hydratase/isomerase family protein [Clostridiales bacterium]